MLAAGCPLDSREDATAGAAPSGPRVAGRRPCTLANFQMLYHLGVSLSLKLDKQLPELYSFLIRSKKNHQC